MRNAMGEPQNIVVFGGTSEIGAAIVRALASPRLRHVVLACRDLDAGHRAATDLARHAPGAEVTVEEYHADRPEGHGALVERIAQTIGDLDVVVHAAGVLGDPTIDHRDPAAAAGLFSINTVGGVSTCLAVAQRLRSQGHGALVVLSSVAGERVRRANYVYGASKAGLDAFAQGLGDDLVGTGAKVLVVRPGFVRTRMTEGMSPAPFATDADAVGVAVARAIGRRQRTIWVPGVLRVVFMVMRHLPGPVWRRLPLR